jgi:lysophospholipase L1-like esterase
MARDGGFGSLVGLALGIGGLGAYLFLRSRPASASGSRSPRDTAQRPSGRPLLAVDGERVLIFGDSLSHPGQDAGPTVTDVTSSPSMVSSAPGAVLAARLLAGVDTGGQRAQAVRINARVGRSARSFLLNEGGAGLLAGDKAFNPTKVLVMLGTNDIDRGVGAAALDLTKDAMRKIRDAYRAMGAEVVAIGPPSYPSDHYTQGAPTMLAAMRDVFGADRTLDARSLTVGAGRSGDGVHFTQAGAALAGKRIAQALTAPA